MLLTRVQLKHTCAARASHPLRDPAVAAAARSRAHQGSSSSSSFSLLAVGKLTYSAFPPPTEMECGVIHFKKKYNNNNNNKSTY